MKRITVLLIFLTNVGLQAQSYTGYFSDNYSGINSVIHNPATIVDSRFKTDINLAGFSILFGNDYIGVGLENLTDIDDFDENAERNATENNNIFTNVDVLGPSFMFNITPKHSVGLFTRGRVFANVNEVNGRNLENIEDDFDGNQDYSINEGDFYSTGTAWAEIGISYATVLMSKEEHFLKGGVSLKYLQGYGNAYSRGRNITIDYDADGSTVPGSGFNTGTVTTTGEITYGSSSDEFDEFEVISGAQGFAADLGVVYEWRPEYKKHQMQDKDGNTYWDRTANKYKVKLGLSVTDLGSINFKNGIAETYDVTNSLSEQTLDNADGLDDLLENFYTLIGSSDVVKTILPAGLHFNADWNINQSFYLNLNTDFGITSRTKENVNRITNSYSITPRFESKWFTAQLPISYMQYSGFQAGFGFRAGPLYVGSGSIISLALSDKSKVADIYLGLKVPIYHAKPKDKDGDGVLDKVDDCPEKSGPSENFGCPWPDTDGDSVLDKDDKCPKEAGPTENNGCPWPDTDGDSILDKDDKCPEEAGPAENNGCPWLDTDGDTVLDKDDKCPEVAGVVANNGCPEVKKVTVEVQKKLNAYAKTILFNTGKSTIKEESYVVLIDIVNILKEYPNAKFTVEGHTDSSGSNSSNQRLSESRATSVKDFLVNKGVDSSKLTAYGFGEDRPIGSNATRDGRAQNRRVEINLVK